MPELTAKVAAVLDEFRIAVNAGVDNGVRVGDRVNLWRVVDVQDPDSGGQLGTVRLEKLRLVVEDVQARLAVAKVFTPAFSFTNVMFNPRPEKTIKVSGSVGGDVRVVTGEDATIYLEDREETGQAERALDQPAE